MSTRTRLPIATLVLIASNMVAAFWATLQPEAIDAYGFVPAHPSFIGFTVGLFLHQNLLHLAGNMLFLAAVGPAVEYAAGSWRFLAVYLAGGVCGSLAHWALISPAAASAPVIGASGCIAACAAYYTIRYIGLKVPIAPGVGVPVAAITGVWIVLQAGGAVFQIGSDRVGAAFWSHLGGFAAGLVLSLVFRAPDLSSIQLGHEALERMNQRGPGATLAMAERHLAQHPDDFHALEQKAEAEGALGDKEAEQTTLLRMFELSDDAQIADVVDRLERIDALEAIPSIKRTLCAERIKGAHPEAARTLLEGVAGATDDPQRPEALLALAGLDRDTAGARRWLDALAKDYPLHPATESARSRGWLA